MAKKSSFGGSGPAKLDRRRYVEMASQTFPISASPGASPARPPAPIQTMGTCSQNFIGAVQDEWQLYSDRACDYTIGEPIGFGASSIVYAAQWKPQDDPDAKPVPCALKTTLMSLSKHPNVLRVRGSWIEGHKLFIALRLMNKGSAADVMRYGWPGGLEEEVIKCILRQALKGLNYLHVNGFIHRDIKAANLLIDDDGTVLLGDLGVAADLSEDPHHHSSRSKSSTITATAALSQPRVFTSTANTDNKSRTTQSPTRPSIGKRKSFVGTPCWMAPELIQGKQYDASADIWSFGITALELSQGHPPRFRESPQRVLLRTLREEPPTLNRDGSSYKYTRAFKEMVDSCLVKDPSKRPTTEQLLQSPFFRSAKKKSYLVNAILKDLPPLVQRQERRALQSMASPNSIDSWDFATTINSPATSTLRCQALEELVAAEEMEELANDAIFEMEPELMMTRSLTKQQSKHPRHERDMSSGDHPEFHFDTTQEEEEEEEEEGKMAEVSSSTTGSELSRSTTDSTRNTSDPSTPSSSYMVSSSASTNADGIKKPDTSRSTSYSPNAHAHPQSSPHSKPGATIVSHTPDLPSPGSSPALSRVSSGPTHQLHSVRSDSDVRKSSKSTNLWKKLKNNLKTADEKGSSSTEKRKLGGLLPVTGKGTIGKSGKSSVASPVKESMATAHPVARRLSSSGRSLTDNLIGAQASASSSSLKLADGPVEPAKAESFKYVQTRLDARHYKTPEFAAQLLKIVSTLQIQSWTDTQIKAEDIVLQRVSGAFTNAVFFVSYKNSSKVSTVLLRIYGPSSGFLISRPRELHILHKLSSVYRIGPRVLGTFENGRLEEYFDSTTLTAEDIRDPLISRWIGARMAEFHSVDMEVVCPPSDIPEAGIWKPSVETNVSSWLPYAHEVLSLPSVRREVALDLDITRFEKDWNIYLEWLSKVEDKRSGSAMVFGHNDAQYGNLLRLTDALEADEHRQIVIVDLEYASPNPAAYDIGIHFHAWCANYHGDTPNLLDQSRYPTFTQRRNFYTSYIKHSNHLGKGAEDPVFDPSDLDQIVEALDYQVRAWSPAFHGMAAIWAIVQAREDLENSTAEPAGFDYVGYAKLRMEAFRMEILDLGVCQQ
ncbi:hypothetical protein H1R20_g8209, partial [Candolleomyces eurysporus]